MTVPDFVPDSWLLQDTPGSQQMKLVVLDRLVAASEENRRAVFSSAGGYRVIVRGYFGRFGVEVVSRDHWIRRVDEASESWCARHEVRMRAEAPTWRDDLAGRPFRWSSNPAVYQFDLLRCAELVADLIENPRWCSGVFFNDPIMVRG